MKIVFVHLGSGKAKHLESNLKRFRKIFNSVEVVLIVSKDSSIDLSVVPEIEIFEYSPNQATEEKLQKLTYNPKFRKGFWRYSLERIFALEQFHKTYPEVPLLHLESDCLILPNFPFDKFAALDTLYWTRDTESADVATILYSPNHVETSWLASTVTSLLDVDHELTDMTALSRISHNHVKRARVLPSTPDDDWNKFNGLFDPAGYGVWLTGQDPRNNFGVILRGTIGKTTLISPGKFKYKITDKEELQLLNGEKIIPIYNLHIHSKNLHLFSKHWEWYLKIELIKAQSVFKNTFSIRAFFHILEDIHRRHNLRKIKTYKIIAKIIFNRIQNLKNHD